MDKSGWDATFAARFARHEDDSLLAIERRFGGERLVALFNFSDAPKRAKPEGVKGMIDLWTGSRVRAVSVTVPAGGFLWLAGNER